MILFFIATIKFNQRLGLIKHLLLRASMESELKLFCEFPNGECKSFTVLSDFGEKKNLYKNYRISLISQSVDHTESICDKPNEVAIMECLRVFQFLTVAIALCDGNSILTFPRNEAEFLSEQRNFPVTHEKIIVPVEGFDSDDKQPEFDEKPVHEELQESNFRGKLKFLESLKDPESEKYVENSENSSPRHRRVVQPYNPPHPHPLYHYQHRHHPNSNARNANEIQPLHVDTSHFKPSPPTKLPPKPHPNGKYSAKLCQHDNNHYNGKLKKHQNHVQGVPNHHLKLK